MGLKIGSARIAVVSTGRMDGQRIYDMLTPKPKELLGRPRRLLREGTVAIWDESERMKKERYLFLFNDVLLITKKEGRRDYWLKVYISLRSEIIVEDVRESPTEFRIYAPKKTFIIFGINPQARDMWVKELQRCGKGSSQVGVNSPGASARPGAGRRSPISHRSSRNPDPPSLSGSDSDEDDFWNVRRQHPRTGKAAVSRRAPAVEPVPETKPSHHGALYDALGMAPPSKTAPASQAKQKAADAEAIKFNTLTISDSATAQQEKASQQQASTMDFFADFSQPTTQSTPSTADDLFADFAAARQAQVQHAPQAPVSATPVSNATTYAHPSPQPHSLPLPQTQQMGQPQVYQSNFSMPSPQPATTSGIPSSLPAEPHKNANSWISAPSIPFQSNQPVMGSSVIQPMQSMQPMKPMHSLQPMQPMQPFQPMQTMQPSHPSFAAVRPVSNSNPSNSADLDLADLVTRVKGSPL